MWRRTVRQFFLVESLGDLAVRQPVRQQRQQGSICPLRPQGDRSLDNAMQYNRGVRRVLASEHCMHGVGSGRRSLERLDEFIRRTQSVDRMLHAGVEQVGNVPAPDRLGATQKRHQRQRRSAVAERPAERDGGRWIGRDVVNWLLHIELSKVPFS